jgi:hypothetical protein
MNKVRNLITEEVQVFENGYDLETNLISAIIFTSGDVSKILDFNYRDIITRKAKVEYITSVTGKVKVYSPVYDMVSYIW